MAPIKSKLNKVKQPLSQEEKDKLVLNVFLQELALMLLAKQPIKSALQAGAEKSRGAILTALEPEERVFYVASRNVMFEFARQLAGCKNLEMLAKTLQIVQGINEGSVVEYEAVKDQLLDEPI